MGRGGLRGASLQNTDVGTVDVYVWKHRPHTLLVTFINGALKDYSLQEDH